MVKSEAMAARKGGKGEFDWGNSKEKDGVCHRCGRSGHVARRCVADMPDDVKAKLLTSKHDAGAADFGATDFGVLSLNSSDDEENVALPTTLDGNCPDLYILSDDSDDDRPPSRPKHSVPDSSPTRSQFKGVQEKTKKKARRGHRGRGGKQQD
ncbi:hypothetical protein C8R47DRAFT_1081747 [Mycena vitilis]|nr:hypothetical protein C8R47DRAFT_1081747 [Mycena vitilis]